MPEEKGSYLRRTPEARALVQAGIRPKEAVRLARAGFTSLEKIASVTRDDLLAIYNVGLGTIEVCERLIGHPLPWPTQYWRERGLPGNIARALCGAGIDSLEALGKQTFRSLRSLGVGPFYIRHCEELLGRPFEEG